VVAKVGMDTTWILEQLDLLIASGEILQYDTAVVWIGVNCPFYALEGIPEIYRILHSYGIKIVGITQYKHNYMEIVDERTLQQIEEFDEIIRTQADQVIDLALDPEVVDTKGFVHLEITQDGLHPLTSFARDFVSSRVNEKLEKLYAPVQTVMRHFPKGRPKR